jgi:hypothetical protein
MPVESDYMGVRLGRRWRRLLLSLPRKQICLSVSTAYITLRATRAAALAAATTMDNKRQLQEAIRLSSNSVRIRQTRCCCTVRRIMRSILSKACCSRKPFGELAAKRGLYYTRARCMRFFTLWENNGVAYIIQNETAYSTSLEFSKDSGDTSSECGN